jgi:hypothetical protein
LGQIVIGNLSVGDPVQLFLTANAIIAGASSFGAVLGTMAVGIWRSVAYRVQLRL